MNVIPEKAQGVAALKFAKEDSSTTTTSPSPSPPPPLEIRSWVTSPPFSFYHMILYLLFSHFSFMRWVMRTDKEKKERDCLS